MSEGIWIALGVIAFLLVLFIFFDRRKKIFKKKDKSKQIKLEEPEKKNESPVKDEKKKIKKISNSKISYSEKVKEEKKEPKVEEIDFETEEEKIVYQNIPSAFSPKRRMSMPFDNSSMSRRITSSRKVQKKKIKDQIKDLSPEMKAIIFTNALGKYEDK